VRATIAQRLPRRWAGREDQEFIVADTHSIKGWGRHVDEIMLEIARQALNCKVRLLDPGVIDAVLRDNDSVCGARNPIAFRKLRDLLRMGFVVRGKAFEQLGAAEAEALVTSVRELLRERIGDRLGGPATN
jgi:hypothetical protein